MLDIIEYDGQPALQINGVIIGTEKEVLHELRQSSECDTWKQAFFELKTLYDELTNHAPIEEVVE